MGKLLKYFFLLLLASTYSFILKSQTTLTAGQAAITGFNFDDPDEFSFVLLTDITTGTVINFTDNGWLASGSFRAGEGTCVWTANSNLSCGTEITILGTTASTGTVSSNSILFSSSGDQILMYQGAAGSPTHIFALNSEATGWQADATSANTSAIPTGLTNGTNAIALNEIDNSIYNCSVITGSGPILSAICNTANWNGNDVVRVTLGSGCAFACVTNTITTSAIAGSPFNVNCTTSAAVSVPFTSTGTFNAGNIYTAQLSDATGSFASPTIIGTLVSTANSGTIAATIAANTPSGTLYRIRVISDNPIVTGSDNGTDLTINNTGACGITTGVIVGSPFTVDCTTWDNVDVPFTTVGTYVAGNIFSAQISDATGSFASPITIGNISLSGVDPSGNIPSTIFAGLTAGANYRIRVVSSNPVQIGTDNGVDITIINPSSPCYGPLVVNEISQGGSGNLEYFELLVVSNNPCSTLDLRNFILDDNNGDFSGGPVAGAGIAGGHIRFSNDNQWANVPSGSLIVVYNEAERNPAIPADDPSDLLVPDKVYILPANHSLLEGCSTRPTATDGTYSPCVYGIGVWNYISMANSADAAQVRYPNGVYSHGYSWGGAPMDGGPDAINVGTTSTSNQNIFFDNTTNSDYTDVANFTRGSVPANETPGAGNSAANSAFISSLICVALPVELIEFNVIKQENYNQVYWKTTSEINSDKFILERSIDMINFSEIYQSPAAGNSSSLLHYNYADDQIILGTVYYRLKIYDLNGEFTYSNPRAITRFENYDGPFIKGNLLIFNGCDERNQLRIFDLSGKLIEQKKNLVDHYNLSFLANGVYLIEYNCHEGSFRFKYSIFK